MAEKEPTRYFLGANSADGFYSLYSELTSALPLERIWYIKGGPGNGKSTFMSKTAQAAEAVGHEVERILCSGDPDSLDGIYIPDLRTAYVDATSPHVQEPQVPGAVGRYIDLSAFYKNSAPYDVDAICGFFRAYREQYARAYSLLRSASLCAPAGIPGIVDGDTLIRVRSMAQDFAGELPEAGGGHQRRLFLSANSCRGDIVCSALLRNCGKLWLLHSVTNLDTEFILQLEEIAQSRRLDRILCIDPMEPRKPEGIIFPAEGVAFYRHHRGLKLPGCVHLYLDRAIPESRWNELAAERRQAAAAHTSLLRQATASLVKAKAYHDELEAIYHPFVYFTALEKFTNRHIKEYIK